ncbi:MAG: hypothetical protein ACTHJK_05585 [Sphingomicrobium sp.]
MSPIVPFVRLAERMGKSLDRDPPSPTEAPARYEPLDVPPWVPFWLGCLLAFSVIGVLVFITIGFPLADHQEYRGPLRALPPAPTLQVAPVMELQRYKAAKLKELDSSQLPIEQAMRETAKQGWGPPK